MLPLAQELIDTTQEVGVDRLDPDGRAWSSSLMRSHLAHSNLAVADRAYEGPARGSLLGTNQIRLVDLDTWTTRTISFDRSSGEIGTFMVELLDDRTAVVTSSYSRNRQAAF